MEETQEASVLTWDEVLELIRGDEPDPEAALDRWQNTDETQAELVAKRNYAIAEACLGRGLSQREAGREFGLTHQRIQQVLATLFPRCQAAARRRAEVHQENLALRTERNNLKKQLGKARAKAKYYYERGRVLCRMCAIRDRELFKFGKKVVQRFQTDNSTFELNVNDVKLTPEAWEERRNRTYLKRLHLPRNLKPVTEEEADE